MLRYYHYSELVFIINLNASNFQHLFPYAYIYTIVSLLKTIRDPT